MIFTTFFSKLIFVERICILRRLAKLNKIKFQASKQRSNFPKVKENFKTIPSKFQVLSNFFKNLEISSDVVSWKYSTRYIWALICFCCLSRLIKWKFFRVQFLLKPFALLRLIGANGIIMQIDVKWEFVINRVMTIAFGVKQSFRCGQQFHDSSVVARDLWRKRKVTTHPQSSELLTITIKENLAKQKEKRFAFNSQEFQNF